MAEEKFSCEYSISKLEIYMVTLKIGPLKRVSLHSFIFAVQTISNDLNYNKQRL